MLRISAHALPTRKLCAVPAERHPLPLPSLYRGAAIICLALLLVWLPPGKPAGAAGPAALTDDIRILSAYGDRRTGSDGARQAADYIQQVFQEQGYDTVGRFRLQVPVRQDHGSTLRLDSDTPPLPLRPLLANSISPGTLPPEGVRGPLIYVGPGNLADFNGLDVHNAIVLMEMTSGKNWQNAANLGARALIYIDRGASRRPLFYEKYELTPIDFPRFWVTYEALQANLARDNPWHRASCAARCISLPRLPGKTSWPTTSTPWFRAGTTPCGRSSSWWRPSTTARPMSQGSHRGPMKPAALPPSWSWPVI